MTVYILLFLMFVMCMLHFYFPRWINRNEEHFSVEMFRTLHDLQFATTSIAALTFLMLTATLYDLTFTEKVLILTNIIVMMTMVVLTLIA